MFDKDRLALLVKQFPNRSFFFLNTVNSTNAFAKTVDIPKNRPAVVLAYEQSSGVGQRSNKWFSEPGKNLTFSLISEPPKDFNIQHYLLVIALAVNTVIHEKLGLKSQIKWPNDILVHGKKIAGILVEAIFEGNHFKRLVTGIGINVNQDSFLPELQHSATSLKLETNQSKDIFDLLEYVLLEIDELNSSMFTKLQYQNVFKEVNEHLAYKNEKVHILLNREQTIVATIIGIDDNGALWVRDEQENFRKFLNEQISIKPIS